MHATPRAADARAPYVVTFQRELSPAWLAYVAALRGVRPPRLDAPFSWLELGCGRGGSAVAHARAFPHARFVAVDQDAAHVEDAARAARGVANLRVARATFAELAGLEGAFELIVAHGVYSWIDDAARAQLRDVLAQRLAPGGLAYVSYNAMPGHAVDAHVQRLLAETASGDVVADVRRVEGLAPDLRFFRAHDAAVAALSAWRRAPAAYVAHEVFGDAWRASYGVDVEDELRAAGLTLVGSATLVDNHIELLVDARTARGVHALPSPRQRALAMAFATNERFRRDVFARAPTVDASALADVLLRPSTRGLDGRLEVPRGALHLHPAFVTAVAACFAGGPARFGDVVSRLATRGKSKEVARNLTWLVAAGALVPWPCGAPDGPRVAG